jgi:hypothetical protein
LASGKRNLKKSQKNKRFIPKQDSNRSQKGLQGIVFHFFATSSIQTFYYLRKPKFGLIQER